MLAQTLFAQTPAPPKAAPPAKRAPAKRGGVVEVGPSMIMLPDKKGELVLAPKDITYEEFIELYKLKQRLTRNATPPAFSLSRSDVSIQVAKEIAQLQIEFSFRIQKSDWVKIPLGLKQLKLIEPPKLAERDNQLLIYDKADGHQLWMRGANPKTTYKLRLKLIQRIGSSGNERRLTVDTPRVNFSQVKIAIPSTVDMEGRVWQSGSQKPPWTVGKADKKIVRWTFNGVGGDVEVAWRRKQQSATRQPPLVVAGNVVVRIEGMKQALRTEVQLNVSSRGVPIQSFLVDLPPNFRLLPFAQPGYSVSPHPSAKSNETLVEVRLDQKTETPPLVRIFGTIAPQPGSTSKNLSWRVEGFSLRRALFQMWRIDFAVDNDMNVRWQTGNQVRRVAAPATAKIGNQPVDARFEYYGSRSSLRVAVSPKPTSVSIQPLYVLRANANFLELDLRLACRTDGTNYWGLALDLNGWQIDEVGPDTFVQTQEMDRSVLSPLVIPLKSAALSSPQMEIRVRARRPMEVGMDDFVVTMPRPSLSRGSQGAQLRLIPSTVVVVPATSIELTPNESLIKGLASEPAVPARTLQEIGETARSRLLAYREIDAARAPPVFAAKRLVRKQAIAADVQTTVRIERREAGVRQQIDYTIDFEPTDTLELLVPNSLIQDGMAQFSIKSKEFGDLMAMPNGNPGEETTSYITKLPRKVNGSLSLQLQYLVTMPELKVADAVAVDIPLIQPVESEVATLNKNLLTLRVDSALNAIVKDDAWEASDQPPGAKTWNRNDATDTVQLAVARNRQSPGFAHVSQIWVQTWLSDSSRMDRAVFQIESSPGQISIAIPDEAEVVKVGVNGAAQSYRKALNNLSVDLAIDAKSNSRQVVEIWYRCAPPKEWNATIQMPQVRQARSGTRFFWHLVIPQHQLLVTQPASLTSQNSWGWQGWRWGRQPELSQRQLEELIHASKQVTVPSASNQYLFTAFDFTPEIRFTFVNRRTAFLFSSLLVLGIGLLLLRFSLFRHPGVLMALAVGTGYGVLVYPQLFITFAQTAVLGFIIIFAGALARSLMRRDPITFTRRRRAGDQLSTTRAADALSSMSLGSSEAEVSA